MQKTSRSPDLERLSTLTATILLVYAMSQFIRQPAGNLSIQLPGFFLPISFNFRNLVWIGIVFLAGAGMNWMLEDRIPLDGRSRLQHWLLPALTAWVIGVPLYSLPLGTLWFLVYILGGVLLTMVFVAEYYTADPRNERATLAALVLTGISYALFLVLAVSIRYSGTRLYLLTPAIGLGAILVSMRTLYLRTGGNWLYAWSAATALLISQVAVGMYYLPIMPIQFGLILVGLLYAAVNLGDRAATRPLTRGDLLEPGLAVAAGLLLAVLIH